MKSVVVSPAAERRARQRGREEVAVGRPHRRGAARSSASASRAAASARVGAWAMTLASMGSNRGAHHRPGLDPGVPPHGRLGCGRERGDRARGRQEARGHGSSA